MENRQNKPPEGGAASGHGGQKFHTNSEQAKLHKSKLRMESREERLNKARERLAKQKPPKKPGPVKRIARIAGHETHAFLHGKVYQEERDNVGVEGGHFVERSGEAALHYGRHKVRRAIREHPAKAAARAESRYIKATADYHSRKFAQEQPEAQSTAARLWHRHKLKREYQRKARETAKQTAKAAEQTVSATERFVREAAAFVKRHPVGTLLALGCLLVVLTLQSCMSSMQIQNLNTLVDTVRHEIIERYRPGEDDPHLKVLQAAHISDDEYFSHMVLDDLNLIIRDIRETHKKDSESAPQTTVANELKENLEAVENFKGSRLEKLAVLYCKQLGINYKNLSDEEFRWLIRILQKSKKTGTPINQRKKR